MQILCAGAARGHRGEPASTASPSIASADRGSTRTCTRIDPGFRGVVPISGAHPHSDTPGRVITCLDIFVPPQESHEPIPPQPADLHRCVRRRHARRSGCPGRAVHRHVRLRRQPFGHRQPEHRFGRRLPRPHPGPVLRWPLFQRPAVGRDARHRPGPSERGQPVLRRHRRHQLCVRRGPHRHGGAPGQPAGRAGADRRHLERCGRPERAVHRGRRRQRHARCAFHLPDRVGGRRRGARGGSPGDRGQPGVESGVPGPARRQARAGVEPARSGRHTRGRPAGPSLRFDRRDEPLQRAGAVAARGRHRLRSGHVVPGRPAC